MSERRLERHDREHGQPSDAQLVDRIRRGDVRAFERLAHTHWDGLVAYAQRMADDRDIAQDAVQEAFTRFWQARSELRQRASVRSYLYRAVRNRIIDLSRQRRAWQRWSMRFQHEFLARPPTPADLLDDAELQAALDRAIQALPERRREVFVLAHLQDLSYNEIAEIMGVAPQTVANHMSLALRELRRALGPLFPQFAAQAPPPMKSAKRDSAS